MPIHDVGYRKWFGQLTAVWSRWWVIAESSIRTNFQSRWIRRTLLVTWLPVIFAGITFFGFEKMMEQWRLRENALTVQMAQERGIDPTAARRIVMRRVFNDLREGPFEILPHFDRVQDAILSGDHNFARNVTWNWLLMNFFRYPQGTMLLLLVGLIAPPLIAQDVRSRAFQLYYSRPIGRLEYILGKLFVPAFFVTLITTVPAVALYFFGVLMSPDLSVLADTWDIPFRIFVASFVLILPTCSLALMLSSLTHESRFAGFAWFTVWGLGIVAWSVIFATQFAEYEDRMRDELALAKAGDSQWSLLSLYSTLGKAQSYIFGLETRFSQVWPSFALLFFITVFSCFILYRRVSAPIQV